MAITRRINRLYGTDVQIEFLSEDLGKNPTLSLLMRKSQETGVWLEPKLSTIERSNVNVSILQEDLDLLVRLQATLNTNFVGTTEPIPGYVKSVTWFYPDDETAHKLITSFMTIPF